LDLAARALAEEATEPPYGANVRLVCENSHDVSFDLDLDEESVVGGGTLQADGDAVSCWNDWLIGVTELGLPLTIEFDWSCASYDGRIRGTLAEGALQEIGDEAALSLEEIGQ
jgi:hypothetical protein